MLDGLAVGIFNGAEVGSIVGMAEGTVDGAEVDLQVGQNVVDNDCSEV